VLDIDNGNDLDILGVTEFDLAALVKAKTMEVPLTDPSKGDKQAGTLTLSYEEEAYCADFVNLSVGAAIPKPMGAGCCGGGDHPQFVIQRQIGEG